MIDTSHALKAGTTIMAMKMCFGSLAHNRPYESDESLEDERKLDRLNSCTSLGRATLATS